MKLAVFIFFFAISQLMASEIYSQSARISLHLKDVAVKEVLNEIEENSEFRFLYNSKLIDVDRSISVDFENQRVSEVLDKMFQQTDIVYTVVDWQIVLTNKGDQNSFLLNSGQQPTKTISGKVTDSSGASLPGASVVVKGTTTGNITDSNGNYNLTNVPGNATLLFSFVGTKTQEVVVGDRSTINVILIDETIGIEEVVAVGYGTMRKADLTGSVSSVSSKNIKDLQVTRVEQAMLGKIAGVQVKPISGQPGTAPQIRIRGIGSISAGSDPLYVVDGFPVADIQTLNPSDIETLDILKDASATAIYGSRGSNGVIIITTKRGKEGKAIISFDTYYGFQQVSLKPVMMNSKQEAQYFYDGVRNRNLDAGNDVSGYAGTWKLVVPQTILDVLEGRNNIDVNWLDQILQTAPQQQQQLTIRGGDKNFRYSLSGEYLDQEGIIKNTDFKRYSVRANIDAQLTKKLALKLNLNPSFTNEKIVQASGITSGPNENVLGSAMAVTPFYPIYDSNGDYYSYNGLAASGNFFHPLALVNEIKHTKKGISIIGNINAEYKIINDLSLNILTGINMRSIDEEKFRPKLPAFLNNVAYGSDLNSMDYTWLTEYTLNYKKSIKNHNITGLVGYTAQKESYHESYIYSEKFSNNLVPTLSAVSGIITNGTTSLSQWSMVSYLARLNYNYNSKYFLTASIRTDGSSRFGSEKKYGIFPSAAFAWHISDENFLKGIKPLSDLKLRASYGVTGNNNIGNYDHIATISYENYALGGAAAGGYAPARFANPLLTWETQKQFNLGFDLSLFKQRLNIIVDNFQSINNNLLLSVNVPDVSGFNTALQNIGEVKNRGWEFVVNTVNIKGKFEWATDFNLSTYRNKVVKLGPSGDPIISGGNITMIGQPIGMFYGWLTNGVFKNQAELDAGPIFAPGTASRSRLGDTRFVDVSGPDGKPDGIINSLDKTIMGSPYPDFYYGMTNRFSYKNISFSISLQGSKGAQILSQTRLGANMSTRARTNQLAISNNYWKSPEDPGDGNTPRPNDAPTGNIRGESQQKQLDTGTYLRINNMSLGYQLPTLITNKLNLSSIRVYLNASNPFIFTKYTSFNPDSSNSGNSLTPGLDANDYPLAKSISLGLNVIF